jgi:hypothetical protein
VSERVLFLPHWNFSPRACEEVVAVRAALDRLRVKHDLEVFPWPWFVEERSVGPTFEEGAKALCEHLIQEPESRHVVAAPGGSAIMLMALARVNTVATFVMGGLSALPATLRAVGMRSVGDAATVRPREATRGWGEGWSNQAMRPVLEGASEEELRRVSHLVEGDLTREQAISLLSSYSDLDLLREADEVTIPTLYLQPSLALSGSAEMLEVVRLLAPGAKIDELAIWPGRLQDEASGHELADKASAFIQKHLVGPAG